MVPLDEKAKKIVLASLHEMSTKALRCLGFAYKEDLAEFATYDGENHPAHKLLLDPVNYAAIETDLIFAGLAGLRVSCCCQLELFPINYFFTPESVVDRHIFIRGMDQTIYNSQFLPKEKTNLRYFNLPGPSQGRGL